MRIYLTGELCVLASGSRIGAHSFPGRQGRLAFAYLVTERSRPVTTSELSDVLWPDRPPDAYEVAVSALISKLRRVLGHDAIRRSAGAYLLRLPAGAWVDTEVAHVAVHYAESMLPNDFRGAYGQAVVGAAILRRPFLSDETSEWAHRRRQELQGLLVRALDALAVIHQLNGEPQLAIRAAEQSIDLEPMRESGYRSLMELHIQNRDRAAAKAVLERCRRVLATELGVHPSPETVAVLT